MYVIKNQNAKLQWCYFFLNTTALTYDIQAFVYEAISGASERIKWALNEVCEGRVNMLDMLIEASIMLDGTWSLDGHIMLPELCDHVVFARGPLSVTDPLPTQNSNNKSRWFLFWTVHKAKVALSLKRGLTSSWSLLLSSACYIYLYIYIKSLVEKGERKAF